MKVTEITSLEFGKMVQAASANLNHHADFINKLNVFPVPDGDTGTNMSLSLASGAKYEREASTTAVGELTVALAKGLLMGARGNSGVILSQIFRGFSKRLENLDNLTAQDLADGFAAGAETAYKAVMKPTEGTILTVIREGAKAGLQAAKKSDDVLVVMDDIYTAADKALQTTPDLLPVLKQVGVVDSGGQGLVFVLQAFNDSLNGRVTEDADYQPDEAEMTEMIDAEHHRAVQVDLDPADIKFSYCTQMMVRIGKGKQVQQEFDYDTFYNYLTDLGDSLLVINDDEVVKVHVHTEHPGKVLAWGQQFGDLATIKIDNMVYQQETIIDEDHESEDQAGAVASNTADAMTNPDTAIIAVAAGKGVAELFKSLGVTHVISGGQTMNPSTQDIVDAINASQAKQAIVLPNNKNIFMAAEQAADVADIPTKIVHSKSVSQGMTAMLGFEADNSFEDNAAAMADNLDTVQTGQVTNAIRDTELDGFSIKTGDFMGLVNGKIAVTGQDLNDTTIAMVKDMLDEDSEIVTVIYGDGASADSAQALSDAILAVDDELEVEVHEGDQPVYPYLISVE
ncbi:DAK2 domain-containing protein [Levilactobacillus bambusae]|uniref:DhaL domain-containing protein n=1 Tax=Levilactobacillus bambusae TaxID=2024736 RepID=A0A2V1N0X1_9LACO|nr:DAK2 domain-containing protein [Levilactobacillus bambusae]PWG00909.1 hypothetical protein DCM90_01670 [Levilactobacillus bambusae]